MPIEVEVICDPDDRIVSRIGTCHCGAEIDLTDPMTNVCECCGRMYNSCGQELRPEEEWEEPLDDD